MIVIYYYEFKADPEHIRVLGWEKGDLPMSRKSAAGWILVCCCFFINLSGKGYNNILRMRKGSSGNGDGVCFVCVCVVIHNAKSRPFSYFTRFLNALNFFFFVLFIF